MNPTDFSEQLNKIMAYYGLSASAFADMINVQRSSVSHILSGRNKPSLDFILKLNTSFPEINLYWLINNSGEMIKKTPSTTPLSQVTSRLSDNTKPTTQKTNSCTPNKEIDRIIIFFKDGTFENYTSKLEK